MGTWTINPDDLAATRTGLGLGTAAAANTGTSNGNVPVVGSDGKLPGAILDIPASGGSISLTASGAIAAGKAVILNANGTVTEGSGTVVSAAIGSSYTPANETATDVGESAYMTVPNKFIQLNRSTISGSNLIRAAVLDVAQDLAITETVAPTAVTGVSGGTPYSITYSETRDRAVAHYQGESPYPPNFNTFSYSAGAGLKFDGLTNHNSGNLPYGSTVFVGADDNTLAGTYAGSPSTIKRRLWTLTTGSDASADSTSSSGGEQAMTFTDPGASYTYYQTAVWFPVQSQLAFITHYYLGATDYRVALAYGAMSGSGGSATWSESGEIAWSDTDLYCYQGNFPYHADTDRAYWFDSADFRTVSMNGGAKKSAIQVINATDPVASSVTVPIPGSNLVVVFAGNQASSSALSYWVINVTAGTNAEGDSFSVTGPVQIASDATYHGISAAYSPDTDSFLVRQRLQSGASKSYGIRIARTTTNISSTNFLGFAASAVGDGAAITVQLPGATATPTGGSLVVGTTYYIQKTGLVGTANASLGIAGRAISSTQLIVEARS